MKERYKIIKGTNNLYYVSDKGNVFSVKSNSILKPVIKKSAGIYIIWFSINGVKIQHKIHRLVYTTFKGDTNEYITHKNGNKLDNTLENLEIKKTHKNYDTAIKKWEKVSVNVFNEDLKYYFTFYSIKECADYLKVSPAVIQKHLQGKTQHVKKLIIKKNLCPIPY